jgi:dephospho-CoA kinase
MTASQGLKVVGLTGGVAAGKSTVAALFRAAAIPVLDMDRIGREILDAPEGIAAIKALFGDRALTSGQVDRKKVREIVFHDEAQRRALEARLHPLIGKKFDEEARAAAQAGATLVVCEAALLIETGRYRTMDALVVVVADEKARVARVTSRDGITEVLARQMISAQVTDEIRRKAATYLLQNDGSEAHLAAQVSAIIDEWKKKGWLKR